jgi:hypothetical protein
MAEKMTEKVTGKTILGNMTRRNLLIALMGTGGALAGTVLAQKSTDTKPPDKFTQANINVRELLLLMDADKNGKISKQEWMNFMEAEFNQLDKDGKGELDPKQLAESRLAVKRGNS